MHVSEKTTVRIAHFSDLHLPVEGHIAPWRLLNKRALGLANLVFNRARTHSGALFKKLLDHLAREDVDLVVVTGDVTNLALDSEFSKVADQFNAVRLGTDSTVIIPGNHDRYTPEADRNFAFERHFSPWLPGGFSKEEGYPYVKSFGQISILAVNTAVWRGPVRAAGYVSKDQLGRLVVLLENEIKRGQHPVIAMHHPPFHLRTTRMRDYRSGLDGADRFIEAIGNREATILHGHLHRLSRRRMGNLDVIGVPSASNNAGEDRAQLGYHIYTYRGNTLETAEIIRLWPGGEPSEGEFARSYLPKRAHAD